VRAESLLSLCIVRDVGVGCRSEGNEK
jgi:hypothetical protein